MDAQPAGHGQDVLPQEPIQKRSVLKIPVAIGIAALLAITVYLAAGVVWNPNAPVTINGSYNTPTPSAASPATSSTTSTSSNATTAVSPYGVVPVQGSAEDTSWSINSPHGYNSLEVEIRPYYNAFSGNQSYYYSMTAGFVHGGANGTYAGLQTDGIINGSAVGKMLLFSVWGATNGISVPGGSGVAFGGEGVGYSERLPYDWQGNNTYLLRIYYKNSTQGSNLWGASLTDMDTNQTRQIGWIYVPISYGNLTDPGTFHELYANNNDAGCNLLSPSEVSFTNMTGGYGRFPATSWDNYHDANVSGCSNYLWLQNLTDGYISAFGVER